MIMSNTRHSKPGSPMSDERFMSSAEYAEVRGLSGNAVAAKAAILPDARQRRLLFFLHSMSWERGGLKQFAQAFLAEFPERFGSYTMRKIGWKDGQIYNSGQVEKVRDELGLLEQFPLKGEVERDTSLDFLGPDEPDKDDHSDCAEHRRWEIEREYWGEKMKANQHPSSYPASDFLQNCREMAAHWICF